MRLTLLTAAGAGLLALAGAAPAHAAAPTAGGCQAFGGNVAGLARDLGAGFGANASFVASQLGPRAFPTMVVFPEQEALCP